LEWEFDSQDESRASSPTFLPVSPEVVANGRGIEVPPQSAGEMRLKPLIVRLLTSAFRYQYREVGLWEVISAVGIDDRQITGDSEVINLDRKPGQLLEAQSTLDGV